MQCHRIATQPHDRLDVLPRLLQVGSVATMIDSDETKALDCRGGHRSVAQLFYAVRIYRLY